MIVLRNVDFSAEMQLNHQFLIGEVMTVLRCIICARHLVSNKSLLIQTKLLLELIAVQRTRWQSYSHCYCEDTKKEYVEEHALTLFAEFGSEY